MGSSIISKGLLEISTKSPKLNILAETNERTNKKVILFIAVTQQEV
jgi:hypothetical protein